MVIKTDMGYYLQGFDIATLLKYSIIIPKSFKEECKNLIPKFHIKKEEDLFRFIGPFKYTESQEWIDKQSFVIDYEEYIEIPSRIIVRKIKKQEKDKQILDEKARRLKQIKRELIGRRIDEDIRATKYEAEKLEFEIAALEIMKDHLDQRLEFTFPKGYTQPKSHKTKIERIKEFFFGNHRIP